MFTLQQVSTAICEASDRSDRSRMLSQVRNLATRVGVGESGDNGLRYMDRLSAAVCAVLVEAVDNGVGGIELRSLESCLRHGRNVVTMAPFGTFEISLDATLRRIAQGENWIVELLRFRDDTGAVQSIPTLARVEPDGSVTRWRVPGDHVFFARLQIEITPMLLRLASALDRASDA